MAASAVGFALAVVFGAEVAVLVAELDEQAVATRPRPIAAVMTTARCRRLTVLPSLEGCLRPPRSTGIPARNGEARTTIRRGADRRCGPPGSCRRGGRGGAARCRLPPAGHTLIHEPAGGPVQRLAPDLFPPGCPDSARCARPALTAGDRLTAGCPRPALTIGDQHVVLTGGRPARPFIAGDVSGSPPAPPIPHGCPRELERVAGCRALPGGLRRRPAAGQRNGGFTDGCQRDVP